jgi:mRNA interferase MazF
LKRGEVWWADLPPPAGRRPVVLLLRDESYAIRTLVTFAPVTSRVRGIPVEVALGPPDGLPRMCAANLDTINTVAKARLVQRISTLSPIKMQAIDAAIRFALGLSE